LGKAGRETLVGGENPNLGGERTPSYNRTKGTTGRHKLVVTSRLCGNAGGKSNDVKTGGGVRLL